MLREQYVDLRTHESIFCKHSVTFSNVRTEDSRHIVASSNSSSVTAAPTCLSAAMIRLCAVSNAASNRDGWIVRITTGIVDGVLSSAVRSETGGGMDCCCCCCIALDLPRPRRPQPPPLPLALPLPPCSPLGLLLTTTGAIDDEGCVGLDTCPLVVVCNVTLVLPNKSAASTSAG